MNIQKWFVSVFVCFFVLVQVLHVPVLSVSFDKSGLLVEGASILQDGFVGPVNTEMLIGGARKALVREIQVNPVLRTKPS